MRCLQRQALHRSKGSLWTVIPGIVRVVSKASVRDRQTIARAKLGKSGRQSAATFDSVDYEVYELGPAFQATLNMLEWPRVCEQVAEFASTHVGKRACLKMLVPEDQRMSERLAVETRYCSAHGTNKHSSA